MSEKFYCPWPGPRPYDVQDGYVFFGRDDEIIDINRRIINDPVTVLSADSGVGKTSLLRAGLVYKLLENRGKGKDIKPIVLLHKWSGAKVLPIERVFADALNAAIEFYDQLANKIDATDVSQLGFLSRQARHDHELLSSVDRGDSFLEHIINICDHPKMGGVILILDQFEEILRSREENVVWVFHTISKLYNHESRVKIVISLRQEFEPRLRRLQSETGLPLGNLTKLLKPMVASNARKAILEVAERVDNLIIKPPVDQTLINKISLMTKPPQIDAGQVNGQIPGAEDTVDLLKLQAILRQLFEYSYDPQNPGGDVVIDVKALEAYENQFNPGEMVGQSLIRWVETALGTHSSEWLKTISDIKAKKIDVPDHLKELYMLPEVDIRGFIRRVGASLSPYLSSGGLKLSQEQSSLLFNTLERDIRRIYKDFDPDDWLISIEPYPKLEPSNNQVSRNDTDDMNLSGFARIKKWTPVETIEILVAIFYETLLRLEEQYILKKIQTGENIFYELTHDGLGIPFITWAGKQTQTWQDCLYSLTINRGIDMVINEPVSVDLHIIERNRWRGCYINPRESARIFHNIQFIDSELIGCVFDSCHFQGLVIDNCDLDGSMFINCRFEPAPGSNEPIVFNNCRATGLTFFSRNDVGYEDQCVLNNVIFENCKLSQINFHHTRLEGNVHFGKDTNITQAQFTNITLPSGENMMKITMGDETELLQYCIWDHQSINTLDFGKYVMSQKVSDSGLPVT